MTTQEAYDRIYRHFNTPDATLASQPSGICKYRLTDALGRTQKCGVGVLIPNDLYADTMENKTALVLLDEVPILRGYFWDVDKEFLVDVQKLHDRVVKNANALVVALPLLAKAYNLKPHPFDA